METLCFVQIEGDNEVHFNSGLPLYRAFLQELDQHRNATTSDEEITEQFRKRVNIQGNRPDMHFEICYKGEEAIGLAFFAIDLGGIRGLIDPNYGFIMGYYVAPGHRRHGIGHKMYEHVESILRSHGAVFIYTSPDPITGEPFWSAMGFRDSGKIDPDDKLPIYIKDITKAP